MARIRTIKPEFFTSADIAELTPLARLFYIALWCEADKAGRLVWNPKTLKLRYFPADDCQVDDLADELVQAGLVIIYEDDGKEYAEIPSFARHQVINNREHESQLPPRVKDACPRVQAEGRKEGKEGKGTRVKRATQTPDDFPLTDPMKEWASTNVPHLNLSTETAKFLDYHRAKGSRHKDWTSAWRNWMRKAAEFKPRAVETERPYGAGGI